MRRFRVRKWATPHCGVAKKALAHPLPTNLLLHKIFAGALKEGAAIISLPPSQREVPRARMCGRAAEGFALIFQVRFRSRQFSSSIKTPKLLFFRSLKTASSFPEEGDDVQCVKRGEGPPKKLPRRARQEVGITSSLVAVKRGGPPKKNIPAPSSERGGTTPDPENNKKTAPPRGRTEEGFICQIQL